MGEDPQAARLGSFLKARRAEVGPADVGCPPPGISVVCDLTLQYEALEIPDSDALVLFSFTAQPGSPSEDSLRLLGSWVASSASA